MRDAWKETGLPGRNPFQFIIYYEHWFSGRRFSFSLRPIVKYFPPSLVNWWLFTLLINKYNSMPEKILVSFKINALLKPANYEMFADLWSDEWLFMSHVVALYFVSWRGADAVVVPASPGVARETLQAQESSNRLLWLSVVRAGETLRDAAVPVHTWARGTGDSTQPVRNTGQSCKPTRMRVVCADMESERTHILIGSVYNIYYWA